MSTDQPSTPSGQGVPQLAEHLFRQETGKLVSLLTGIFGISRLQLAEDVVQESMIRALQTWPYYGIPDNPTGWLMQTAKRLALDVVRREQNFHHKQPEIIATVEQWVADTGEESPMFDDEIKDGRLRLMFACCHPLIPQEAQSALALKTLCGFSPAEIAAAYLTSEAAIAKRLTRARQKIRDQNIAFEIPSGSELGMRLDGVLLIIYLLFNEGYKASSGTVLIREQLCHEAVQLGLALVEHPATSTPRTHALLALMWFNAARFPSRVDGEGNILRLQEQDRSIWNKGMIQRGLHHLSLAASGTELSEYHLQAGIAACHCMAADFASTNWASILSHYDHWLRINPSPLVALNRAVAVAHVQGATAGIAAVEAISDRKALDNYYLLHAVLGDLEFQRQHFRTAAGHFRTAHSLTELESEKIFLMRRLKDCEAT